VVTAQPVTSVLPLLRDVVSAQLAEQDTGHQPPRDRNVQIRKCLERVSISRVFDIEGLWEVLGDLDMSLDPPAPAPVVPVEGPPTTAAPEPRQNPSVSSSPLSSPPPSSPLTAPPSSQPRTESSAQARWDPRTPSKPDIRTEIADSEDGDDDGSHVPSSADSDALVGELPALPKADVENSPPKAAEHPKPIDQKPKPSTTNASSSIVVIAHFSTLLTSLFTQHDKTAAHSTLQRLSSHLRYLSRNLESSPLILLVNTTTTASSSAISDNPQPYKPSKGQKTLNPSLRSIFSPLNPAPSPGNSSTDVAAITRKNKPSFGLVFTQLLDMHLLVSRIPRRREDTEALFAPPNQDTVPLEISFVWVVEVLLDELGVWEGIPKKSRKSREQRWAALDIRNGRRIVEANFRSARKDAGTPAEIRLAGGFGGRRV
jgi:hypothetical protein